MIVAVCQCREQTVAIQPSRDGPDLNVTSCRHFSRRPLLNSFPESTRYLELMPIRFSFLFFKRFNVLVEVILHRSIKERERVLQVRWDRFLK